MSTTSSRNLLGKLATALVWQPDVLAGRHLRRRHRLWQNTLKYARPGEVGVIYESGVDGAIAAVFLVMTPPEPGTDWLYECETIIERVHPAVTRTELLADPRTEPIFRLMRRGRYLPADARAALLEYPAIVDALERLGV